MPSPTFNGVALVTGAASGIGRQVAKSFAAEGCAKIALLDRDEDGLSETARLCKAQAGSGAVHTLVIPFDVRTELEVRKSMDCIVDEWGRIDYAVNCAGIYGPLAPSHELSPAAFDAVYAVNYRGVWLCARAELAQMMTQTPLPTHDGRPGNRGVVVNVASVLGTVSKADTPAYNASKAGVISLTRSDAIDYSKHNIRVNCVCPGVVDTPMADALPPDHPDVTIAMLKRKGTAQEVADAVLFLCSSKATFVQGAALVVDGGYSIH